MNVLSDLLLGRLKTQTYLLILSLRFRSPLLLLLREFGLTGSSDGCCVLGRINATGQEYFTTHDTCAETKSAETNWLKSIDFTIGDTFPQIRVKRGDTGICSRSIETSLHIRRLSNIN